MKTKLSIIATLIVLLISCVEQKPVYVTEVDCQEEKAIIWVSECLHDANIDSLKSPNQYKAYEIYCFKQAREIFCKQVTKQTNKKWKQK